MRWKNWIYSAGLCLVTVFFVFEIVETNPLSAQVEEDVQEDDQETDQGDLLGKSHGRTYVTVKVKDDTWNDVRVVSAELEGRDIHLQKHANIFGFKGSLSVRLNPGDYTLRWTVTKPAARGNRITLSFQKTIHVKKKSVNVTITGQKASVY